jgi:hypothetical protein
MESISEQYGVDQAATGSDRSEPVVSVRGLVKRYGSREAVAGIDLEVRRERSSPSSARTARARPRRLRSSQASGSVRRDRFLSWGTTRQRRAAPGGTGWAWSCRRLAHARASPMKAEVSFSR